MRILHTSDWHLGRTLHGVDLLEHQAAYLDHLVEVARAEDVRAVVVSGDVYDRAIPPVEAVTLLSETLARLSQHAQVVVTPGNHDSAVRLGFGDRILRDGIHVRARVADVGRPVEIPDPDGGAPVLVYAMPYLDPDASRVALQDGDEPLARSHAAVMGAAMRRVRADLAARTAHAPVRSVVMAHAFVVGGEASESERDIRVGGVDSVPAGVFEGVDYVALGHLHGPQRVTFPGATVGRYSGSPLAYSFSEMRHAKSSVLLELSADGSQGVTGEPELLRAPVPRRLSEVSGTLDDLLGAAGEAHRDDWVRVLVTDTARPREMTARVKERFPHALVVQHRPAAREERPSLTLAVTAASDPVVVAGDFVAHVTGATATDAEVAVLRAAFERAGAAERSA
ncbi:exonuclease SbcCD subunit D [Sanguibacter suaedae]|uniref:Nuclease SbcCD subunit D n=1 Tax=Sanguibacter suaedae TaxID=2795737 RepID=A0A934I3K3_9MICO|nr:exonuclease SbcCD subunit D [Sanguibacter suaedae]MBI9113596.1 exonuclease SbcCD subunit D [Sanguibacter suaedae]